MADVIKTYNPAEANKIEEVLVLKQHRAKPVGEEVARRMLPGDTYKQSGIEKIEVLARGLATTDLKAKVPVNTKRVAPKGPGNYPKDPIAALTEQVSKLVEAVEKLITKK